jgi:MFS family permease
LKHCITIASVVAAIIALLSATIHSDALIWAFGLCIGVAVAIAYALLITLFSNQVDSTEQGWVMGVTNSIMALSFGVTTFFSGFALHYSPAMPIFLAFGGMMIAAIILKFAKIEC